MFLAMMFGKAVDYDYIAKNPMAKVEHPKRDIAEKQELTQEEAQALYGAIVGEPLGAKPVGVLLCMFCGLRMSEMLALNELQAVDDRPSTPRRAPAGPTPTPPP